MVAFPEVINVLPVPPCNYETHIANETPDFAKNIRGALNEFNCGYKKVMDNLDGVWNAPIEDFGGDFKKAVDAMIDLKLSARKLGIMQYPVCDSPGFFYGPTFHTSGLTEEDCKSEGS